MIKPICNLSISKFVATFGKCLQYWIIFVHTNGQHVTLQNFDVDIGSSHFKWIAIYNLWCMVFYCVWFVFKVFFVAWSRPLSRCKMFSSMLAISNFYWMQGNKHVKALVILGQKSKNTISLHGPTLIQWVIKILGISFGVFFLQDVLNKDVRHAKVLLRLGMSKLFLGSFLSVVPKNPLTWFIAFFFHRFFDVSLSFSIQPFCRFLGDSWARVLWIIRKFF